MYPTMTRSHLKKAAASAPEGVGDAELCRSHGGTAHHLAGGVGDGLLSGRLTYCGDFAAFSLVV